MRYEFKDEVIYIYNEKDECICRQPHDPRTQTREPITTEPQADEIYEYIKEILEKQELNNQPEEYKPEKILTDKEKIEQLEEYISDIFAILVTSNTAVIDEIPEKIREDVTEALKNKEAESNIVHNYRI